MNSIVPQQEMATDIGQTTEVSWTAPHGMTFEQWASIGRTLQQLGRSLNFWLGDWLNQGELRYGEMYTQALEITGMAPETLSKYKSVAARLPADIRHVQLSWTHHFAVAYAEEHLRGPLLEMAARYELHSRDLKEIMRLKTPQLEELLDASMEEELPLHDFHATINRIRLASPATSMISGGRDAPAEIEATAPLAHSQPTETEVYVEEIFAFFEKPSRSVRRVSKSEVAWEGMVLRAAIDKSGTPVLIWEKTNA